MMISSLAITAYAFLPYGSVMDLQIVLTTVMRLDVQVHTPKGQEQCEGFSSSDIHMLLFYRMA